MSQIFKYAFSHDRAAIEVPLGKVVLVSTQHSPSEITPTVWIEHIEDELESDQNMTLQLIGTGHEIDTFNLEHKGSCVCAHGDLIWHIYGTQSRR